MPDRTAPTPVPDSIDALVAEIVLQQDRLTAALTQLVSRATSRHVRIPRQGTRLAASGGDLQLRAVARQLESALEALDLKLASMGLVEQRPDASVVRVDELTEEQAAEAAEALRQAVAATKGPASVVVEHYGSHRARRRLEEVVGARQALR